LSHVKDCWDDIWQTTLNLDLHFFYKKIGGYAHTESPSHIGYGQRDTSDQQGNKIFFIGLQASQQRTELQAGKHQEDTENRLGNYCQQGESKFAEDQGYDYKKIPIIIGAPPVLAPKR
jgi:hypothetical protein